MGLPLRSPVANYRCEWPYMAKLAESTMKRSVFDCSWILARSLLRIADNSAKWFCEAVWRRGGIRTLLT
jgi:hypothetical protein